MCKQVKNYNVSMCLDKHVQKFCSLLHPLPINCILLFLFLTFESILTLFPLTLHLSGGCVIFKLNILISPFKISPGCYSVLWTKTTSKRQFYSCQIITRKGPYMFKKNCQPYAIDLIWEIY